MIRHKGKQKPKTSVRCTAFIMYSPEDITLLSVVVPYVKSKENSINT